MSLLIVLLVLVVWLLSDIVEDNKPQAPGVKDWDKFNRDTIGMDSKDIKKGLRGGKW